MKNGPDPRASRLSNFDSSVPTNRLLPMIKECIFEENEKYLLRLLEIGIQRGSKECVQILNEFNDANRNMGKILNKFNFQSLKDIYETPHHPDSAECYALHVLCQGDRIWGCILAWTWTCEKKYIVGKHLEGYYEIWGHKIHTPWLKECIELYLTRSHFARRAALQTVVALTPLLGRDVARIIGKLVYSAREEPPAETNKRQKV
jgi:hypothetical protein